MSKKPSPYPHYAMQQQSFEDLQRNTAAFDDLVDATPDIDHFCSSSRWILPAANALMPPREPWIFRGASGQVALMRKRHPEGWHYLEPLEASWGLACPLVGPDPDALAAEFVTLCHRRRMDWDVMLLMGLPVGSALLGHVAGRLHPYYDIFRGQVTTRWIASLEGGIDGFLARRSHNFRKNLRRALRAAEQAGIEFERCRVGGPRSALEVYARIKQIEARSWKGRSGMGIDRGPMHLFYREMVQRLAARGELRVIIARHRERDIAYVLGGVSGRTYRGLQFSFDVDYKEHSLGNLCQYQQILDLIEEDIHTYDLGTDMDYKRHWAEKRHDTLALIVYKRSPV